MPPPRTKKRRRQQASSPADRLPSRSAPDRTRKVCCRQPGSVVRPAGDNAWHGIALLRAGAGVVSGARARPAVARAAGNPVVGSGQRGNAAADAGEPGAARPPRLARQVAVGPRAGSGPAGRGGAAVGPARLPAARAAAARDRRHRDAAVWRADPVVPRGTARAARDRRLHRGGGGCLRLRPPARRAGHQRAPCAGQAGVRAAVPRSAAVGGGVPARGIAAACRPGRRGPLVGRRHGTRRAHLHRRAAALHRLPGRTPLRLASRRPAGGRGQARGAALRGHRPPVPRPSAGAATGIARPRKIGALRRGLAQRRPARPGPRRPGVRRPGRPAPGRPFRATRVPLRPTREGSGGATRPRFPRCQRTAFPSRSLAPSQAPRWAWYRPPPGSAWPARSPRPPRPPRRGPIPASGRR